jgi:hypothetical protein
MSGVRQADSHICPVFRSATSGFMLSCLYALISEAHTLHSPVTATHARRQTALHWSRIHSVPWKTMKCQRPGPSRSYCTHLQLRSLCCNPATRSSSEHCGDITLRRVLGRGVTSWLRNACLPDASSVKLKTYPSSRPVAARAQRHSVSRR